MILAAWRDASFFSKPGRADVFHVVALDGLMACWRRFPVDMGTAIEADRVPDRKRCQRPGCRRHWPKEVLP